MADHAHDAHGHDDQWRKNIPADFEGRHGREWDEEIDVSVVYKSAVAIVIAVAVAFGFCWLLIQGFDSFFGDHEVSALAEARERHLPPSPQLAPMPEAELTALRAQVAVETQEFGWADQAAGRVHIPVDKAMDLVLKGRKIDVELPAGKPVDVAAPAPAEPAPTAEPPAAAEPAPHGGGH